MIVWEAALQPLAHKNWGTRHWKAALQKEIWGFLLMASWIWVNSVAWKPKWPTVSWGASSTAQHHLFCLLLKKNFFVFLDKQFLSIFYWQNAIEKHENEKLTHLKLTCSSPPVTHPHSTTKLSCITDHRMKD